MTETIPVSERLFRYLFEEKGKRVQKIQQTSHARVRMERSPYSVVVSGTKDAVEAAMESLKATEKDCLRPVWRWKCQKLRLACCWIRRVHC